MLARCLAPSLLLCAAALPASAQCRLALALALDVSSSVDADEYRLQRDGLAAALEARPVREALLETPQRWVSLAVYEWSGKRQQAMMLDWTPIRYKADLAGVTAHIRASRRSYSEFPTAIGYALAFGAGLMTDAPPCDRRVIDISGDGISNDGFGPHLAFAHFPLGGVTVNGLVIEQGNSQVTDYYRAEVIRGPGAFIEIAADYDGFEHAMTRKLIREIGSVMIGRAALPRDGE